MVKFPFPFVRNKLRFFTTNDSFGGSNGKFLFSNITWFVNLVADENKKSNYFKILKRLSFVHESMLELLIFLKECVRIRKDRLHLT